MRTSMKTTLLAALLLAGGSILGAQISIGVTIGPPPPPRVLHIRPSPLGPDFLWVEGYWYPVGRHYKWHEGYWTRPPYPSAVWIAPRYDGKQFFEGYWEGDRGRIAHDHRWDHDRDRDFHREGQDHH
ncbi:MAG: YXWGXW repeat-containing protein [Bryobacteraceae bacterium]